MKSIYLFYTAPIALFNATPHGATAPTWGGVSIKNSLNPFRFWRPNLTCSWCGFYLNQTSMHLCTPVGNSICTHIPHCSSSSRKGLSVRELSSCIKSSFILHELLRFVSPHRTVAFPEGQQRVFCNGLAMAIKHNGHTYTHIVASTFCTENTWGFFF